MLVFTSQNEGKYQRVEARPTLQVAAVYDDEQFQLRYRFETDSPSWYHQVLRYEDGRWVRYGTSGPEGDPHGLYEDRISMMLDDGAVDGFGLYGGFMTAHQGMRTTYNEASPETVRQNAYLGQELGRSDVRKYIPQSRTTANPADVSWHHVRPVAELEQLRDEGVFIDLWQWRAHRSNPLGYADNGYILEYRHSSEGQGMYTSNWDEETEQPLWMFDAEQTGFHALDWERLIEQGYGQDDFYYLAEGHAVPFDPNHDWQEGDVIPQRLLRTPSGSRGAIEADGRWHDGAWEVRLTRSLEAPNPQDSKTLTDGQIYNVAFAVHQATGQRWHHISLPQKLSLGAEAEADIVARRVDGPLDEAEADWAEIPLVEPGLITWQWLNSQHPGSNLLQRTDMSVRQMHTIEFLEQRLRRVDRRLEQ
nr:ethylbenzene dehydrogenase-related protein [Alkalilimnicola ehrlichii]